MLAFAHEVVQMEPGKTKLEEAVQRLRDELGAIRSCALLMAHAPAADIRSRYLKTLSERISSMDVQLTRLEQEPQSSG